MDGGDMIFYKKNKLYVADFSSWIQKWEIREARLPLALATTNNDQLDLTTK